MHCSPYQMTSTEVRLYYTEMRLSKDVLMNFYVHQTECKMEENAILLYFFSVLVGRGGGEVSMTHCKTKTRVRTLVNRNEHRLSNEEMK